MSKNYLLFFFDLCKKKTGYYALLQILLGLDQNYYFAILLLLVGM